METNAYLEPFARLVADIAASDAVRSIEGGADTTAMWSKFAASGFLDALVSENDGGVGLSLADVGPLVAVIGANAVPLPVAETMVARALLAKSGATAPDGPIALATSAVPGSIVPCGLVSTHWLIDDGEALVLAQSSDISCGPPGIPYALSARLGSCLLPKGLSLSRPDGGLRPIAAVLRATLISGALARVVEMTAAYANDRVQFGKPVGRQQAVQQNLAVMAQDMVATRIATQMACAAGLDADVQVVAMAKSIASAAAGRVAAGAHGVHGAIGMSEEYDLQLLTRRLYEWRMADGSSRYWDAILGKARLAASATTLDWARRNIFSEAGPGGQHEKRAAQCARA